MGDINQPKQESEGRMDSDLKTFLFQFFTERQLNFLIESLNRIVTREYSDRLNKTNIIQRWFTEEQSPLYGFISFSKMQSASNRSGRSSDLNVFFFPDIEKFTEILNLVLKLIDLISQLNPGLLGSTMIRDYRLLFSQLDLMDNSEIKDILGEYKRVVESKTGNRSNIPLSEFQSNYLDNPLYIEKVETALELLKIIRSKIKPEEA